MSYKSYLAYLSDLGLGSVTEYDYLNKKLNVSLEIERFLNRSVMMFEWHNLPETIPQRQLELMLQCQGYAIIGQIDGKIYACYGGLGGVLDEYFQPTKAIVSIPYLRFNAEWEIGVDCVIIKNDLVRQGMLPLYSKYISLLNETEITMLLSLVNQRVQGHISASDNATIESAKKYLEDLMAGKQGVIADNAFLESLKMVGDNKVGNNLTDIVEVLHYLRGQLYNEVGLATNYNLKKERVTRAEVELNTDNLYPLVDDMMFCRREGIEDCYDLFGVDWSVEFNSSWDYRIMNGEPITTEGGVQDGVSVPFIDSGDDSGIGMAFEGYMSRDKLSMADNGAQEVKDVDGDSADVSVADVGGGDNDVDNGDGALSDSEGVNDGSDNSGDSDIGMSDTVGSVDDGDDKIDKDGMETTENEVSDVSDNVSDVSDNSVSDSVGNVHDVGTEYDNVTDNTRETYFPDDKVGDIIDIVSDLANETADVLSGEDLPEVGLSNDEVLQIEATVADVVNDIAANIVDDLVDDVDSSDSKEKDDKEGGLKNEKK